MSRADAEHRGARGPRPGTEALVRALYPALAAGDTDTITGLLAPDFEGHLTAGLPLGLGGERLGPAAMWHNGWAAIGAAFQIRAEADSYRPLMDGGLLVTGYYRGTARGGRRPVDAEFMHLWEAADGRITRLRQLTDSARWAAALEAV